MIRRSRWLPLAALCALAGLYSTVTAQDSAKKKVMSQTDLPRFTYPVQGSVVDLLNSDAGTFNAFAAQVRTNVDAVFRDYDIQDKATLRQMLAAKLSLEELDGENRAGLGTIQDLRELEEKPASRAMAGWEDEAILKARIESKSSSGPAYEQAFARYFTATVNGFPWALLQQRIRSIRTSWEIDPEAASNRAYVSAELQPMVDKSKVLDEDAAETLLSTRFLLQTTVPLHKIILEVLNNYVAAQNEKAPDIWQARDVTLTTDQRVTPVLVGIWDQGVDTSLFPGQLYTDANPLGHDPHGLAYDDQGAPSTSSLHPLSEEESQLYPKVVTTMRGLQDLDDGIDSAEAEALKTNPGALAEMYAHPALLTTYAHGTHVAGIAVRGNPAARLVVLRFNDEITYFTFPPTAEWVRRMAANFEEIGDYCRSHDVRVVNMSWGDDVAEFETWLLNTGAAGDSDARKQQAQVLFQIWKEGVSKAISGAPGTLFITSAGNSDTSTSFQEEVPASLHLSNLMAVGAVDQAGEETDFTSYGDNVVVDADGYEVESYVPGGARLKLSGTSMASPNVVNLAAKLIALDPSLTPEQTIALIRRGATNSSDGRRHLINPKESVALLQERH